MLWLQASFFSGVWHHQLTLEYPNPVTQVVDRYFNKIVDAIGLGHFRTSCTGYLDSYVPIRIMAEDSQDNCRTERGKKDSFIRIDCCPLVTAKT